MADASTIRFVAGGPPERGLYESAVTQIHGGITAPLGFLSAALHCGIKAKTGALDLTVVAATRPVSAAGLFTTNLAKPRRCCSRSAICSTQPVWRRRSS
jgi:N-acetylglutamate synthase/N-acetylornithine aminotransferase